MLQRIERALREDCQIEPGAVLVVGVSGGPDSLCLLHALHALGHRPIVAHLDHRLRPESGAEAAHVAEFCSRLGLDTVLESQDVAAYAASNHLSTEEAGRRLRYTFLCAQARAHNAVAVAVGHTADDQAETVLLHLLRGSGIAGLGGMTWRVTLPEFDPSIPLVRPLLDTWRRETEEYCRQWSLPHLNDASNESREFTRNRVRLDLIPTLETYNPQVRAALVRLSRSAAEDIGLIEKLVDVAWERCVVVQNPAYVALDVTGLAAQPSALQRRLIMRAALQLRHGSELGFDDLRRAVDFISDPSSRQLQLGDGLNLHREAHTIYVTLGEDLLPSDQWPQLPEAGIPIAPAGAVTVRLAGDWQFTSQLASDADGARAPFAEDPYRGLLDADTLPPVLELRVPRAGDRIEPLGLMGHTQKLSDVFINIRVPERLRPRWPVLASGDTVVWIPGFRIAEPFRIRGQTRRVAVVSVRRSR